MKWKVNYSKKAAKQFSKLPANIKVLMAALTVDLSINGAIPGKKWRNYSKLGKGQYHCHLNYSYVACWSVVDKKIKLMEIYYVGSRENAPY